MIKSFRKKIDDIDRKILKLLDSRMNLAVKIGKIKSEKNEDIFVPVREKEVLTNLVKCSRGVIPNEFLTGIYREILNASRALQKKLKVAYFGPEATFTHLAAMKIFGKSADYVPAETIRDVFNEIEKERADYGVVPVENSTEGVINYTLDMFTESDLKIVSEMLLEISHCLLSCEKSLNTVKVIYSHPQAIAQSRNWIEKNMKSARVVEVISTAEAARRAKREKNAAAIASSMASGMYGLNILAKRIEDFKNNFTRFLVIGRKSSRMSGCDKTSIMFSVKDKVGVLHDILIPFKKYGINLTKIESRPTKKKAWEYIFFVDFLGHTENKNVKAALKEIGENCLILKVLGSYPVEKSSY